MRPQFDIESWVRYPFDVTLVLTDLKLRTLVNLVYMYKVYTYIDPK